MRRRGVPKRPGPFAGPGVGLDGAATVWTGEGASDGCSPEPAYSAH
jgi:hypothetical protein